MICLTGDIHHMSLGTGNQKHCDRTEIEVAVKYLGMLQERNIKVTFFITGKSFVEEFESLKPIIESPDVEIGGHTYFCYQPELWHRISNKLLGSYNGPRWYQHWDTRKTVDIIEKTTGRTIQCWRNHMYMHGPYTEEVLWDCGLKICSDGVQKKSTGLIPHETGLYNYPINIIPDHEHLFHAERTPEWVEWWKNRYNWSDDYGSDSYYVDQWTDIVLEGLKKRESRGIVSNLIIHPITLYLCDRFKSFQRILEYISGCETIHMSDLLTLKIMNQPEIDQGEVS